MDARRCNSSSSSSGSSVVVGPPISPKSPPPVGLDLYGKRRHLVKIQVLEREIDLLQEELKSLEGLQPASRCCKELHDFTGDKPDPFIEINQEFCKSHHFWRRLWGKLCFNLPIHCCMGCPLHQERLNCCVRCPSYTSNRSACSCSENCLKRCKFLGHSCPCCACCCCCKLFSVNVPR